MIQTARFDGTRDTLIARPEQLGGQIPRELAEQVRTAPVERLTALGRRAGVDALRWIRQIQVPDRFPAIVRLFTDPFGRNLGTRG